MTLEKCYEAMGADCMCVQSVFMSPKLTDVRFIETITNNLT